ncbi:MAG: Tn3 family transposase, partial [Bacteroidetes bacterium]|nr:Tn3 family transposase [Bacteroidota bacterium]
MKSSGNRLNILSEKEVQDLYDLPKMSYEERVKYFSLITAEKKELSSFRLLRAKVYFILQLGYFKAKKMFFNFSFKNIEDDIQFILQHHFPGAYHIEGERISGTPRLNQQKRILKLLNYKLCSKTDRKDLLEKAKYLATIYTKPVYIFKELFNDLESRRVAFPAYSFFQVIIGSALSYEESRLEKIVKEQVSQENKETLDKLLTAETSMYELTLLKKEPRDFSYSEIAREVQKRESMKSLYEYSISFLPTLGISNENVKYYASLVDYYSMFRLSRFNKETIYLYLLCFIYNRYQTINENLINSFIYRVRKYADEARTAAKETVYQQAVEGNNHLKPAGKVLKLFVDDRLSDEMRFGDVKQIAFKILGKDKFLAVSQYISSYEFDQVEYEWNHYVKSSMAIKRNLRHIFLNIDFEAQATQDPLIKAVSFLKEYIPRIGKERETMAHEFSEEIIPKKLRRYLIEKEGNKAGKTPRTINGINVDKFEFLVYKLLREGLESGRIYCTNSVSFRSFDQDLITPNQWNNRKHLIQNLSVPGFQKPIKKLLRDLEEELEIKLKKVNERIAKGENQQIKITAKGDEVRWTLPYQKIEGEEVNHPIYEHFSQIRVTDLLHFVHQQTGLLRSFQHILEKHVNRRVDYQRIIAVITAYATNNGLYKMANISDIRYPELEDTSNNNVRLETLKAANDQISNKMAKLPIFKYYDISEEGIHSSSDGQKLETQFDTFNSRYSPKYFGLDKGVTAYTLVGNHVPINAKIIGANEHESHYVFDILYNNTSEIDPVIHSTDTHGTNQVNFALLHFFGYQFATRYKNLSSKANMIYGFKNPSQYDGYLFKPVRKIYNQLIEDEAENMEKILLSLALKTTTQSIMVSKLSSYTRSNKTKRAFWGLENIHRSIYILNYIDSPVLQRGVQKVLNRGENYHQLAKAIRYANGGKLKV